MCFLLFTCLRCRSGADRDLRGIFLLYLLSFLYLIYLRHPASPPKAPLAKQNLPAPSHPRAPA